MRQLFYRGRFLFVALAGTAFVLLVSLVVMYLWNGLMPAIFHLPLITFWQALDIFILSKILFGFGRGGPKGAPWMRHRMSERFKNMSPEEREKFKAQMEDRCGWKKWDSDSRYHFDTNTENNPSGAAKPSE